MSVLIGDKGYDGDGFRAEIINRGAKPIIPNKSNRVILHSFSNAPIRDAMLSNAVSAASRISGLWQLATTNMPETFWLPSTSPQSLHIGSIESEP